MKCKNCGCIVMSWNKFYRKYGSCTLLNTKNHQYEEGIRFCSHRCFADFSYKLDIRNEVKNGK